MRSAIATYGFVFSLGFFASLASADDIGAKATSVPQRECALKLAAPVSILQRLPEDIQEKLVKVEYMLLGLSSPFKGVRPTSLLAALDLRVMGVEEALYARLIEPVISNSLSKIRLRKFEGAPDVADALAAAVEITPKKVSFLGQWRAKIKNLVRPHLQTDQLAKDLGLDVYAERWGLIALSPNRGEDRLKQAQVEALTAALLAAKFLYRKDLMKEAIAESMRLGDLVSAAPYVAFLNDNTLTFNYGMLTLANYVYAQARFPAATSFERFVFPGAEPKASSMNATEDYLIVAISVLSKVRGPLRALAQSTLTRVAQDLLDSDVSENASRERFARGSIALRAVTQLHVAGTASPLNVDLTKDFGPLDGANASDVIRYAAVFGGPNESGKKNGLAKAYTDQLLKLRLERTESYRTLVELWKAVGDRDMQLRVLSLMLHEKPSFNVADLSYIVQAYERLNARAEAASLEEHLPQIRARIVADPTPPTKEDTTEKLDSEPRSNLPEYLRLEFRFLHQRSQAKLSQSGTALALGQKLLAEGQLLAAENHFDRAFSRASFIQLADAYIGVNDPVGARRALLKAALTEETAISTDGKLDQAQSAPDQSPTSAPEMTP